MQPYRSSEGVLVNIEQVIPLQEAEEYQVSVREKRQLQKNDRILSRDTTRRDMIINGVHFSGLPKRRIIFEVVSTVVRAGASIEDIRQRGCLVTNGYPWSVR